MNHLETERTLIKDDEDLFSLVQRVTTAQPQAEIKVQIELPFSLLLDAVDRLPSDKARLLHKHLGERLKAIASL
jgi:hypothetical protein